MRRPIARLTSALSLLRAGAVALVAQQAPPPLVTEPEIRAGLPVDAPTADLLRKRPQGRHARRIRVRDQGGPPMSEARGGGKLEE